MVLNIHNADDAVEVFELEEVLRACQRQIQSMSDQCGTSRIFELLESKRDLERIISRLKDHHHIG